jgi:hypothetical protein
MSGKLRGIDQKMASLSLPTAFLVDSLHAKSIVEVIYFVSQLLTTRRGHSRPCAGGQLIKPDSIHAGREW